MSWCRPQIGPQARRWHSPAGRSVDAKRKLWGYPIAALGLPNCVLAEAASGLAELGFRPDDCDCFFDGGGYGHTHQIHLSV